MFQAVEKAVAEGMAVNADRRLTEKVIRSVSNPFLIIDDLSWQKFK